MRIAEKKWKRFWGGVIIENCASLFLCPSSGKIIKSLYLDIYPRVLASKVIAKLTFQDEQKWQGSINTYAQDYIIESN